MHTIKALELASCFHCIEFNNIHSSFLNYQRFLNLYECAKRQIDKILEAPFDYIVIESPLGEFLPDLMRYIPKTIKKIEDYIINEKKYSSILL